MEDNKFNNSDKSTEYVKKTGMLGVFAVACVLFGSHAGGGFATGNQATQNYVVHGWVGVIMAVVAMALLTLTIRECMIMYNSRGLKSYKELFQTLYHPLDKLEIVFEIYFYIMVICAVGAVISGAATLFAELGIMSYVVAVFVVGIILLALTIFGANLVSQVSTIMSVAILVCSAIIFIMGINARADVISNIFSEAQMPNGFFLPLLDAFKYAGFQAVVIPTMIKCGQPLKTKSNASKSMAISFFLNAFALCLSCVMLLGWYAEFSAAEKTDIPSLYICQQLGAPSLYWFYNIALFLCFISTGVTTVFGFVSRFEHIRPLQKIQKPIIRRIIVSACIMFLSMAVSMVGLSNIIKFGYGYCGYLGILIIILPFLTVGVYKNRKYLKEHPEFKK